MAEEISFRMRGSSAAIQDAGLLGRDQDAALLGLGRDQDAALLGHDDVARGMGLLGQDAGLLGREPDAAPAPLPTCPASRIRCGLIRAATDFSDNPTFMSSKRLRASTTRAASPDAWQSALTSADVVSR
jgi:hypothetical protein